MDQPKIPTLKDAQKPQVKVKGLGSGLTLFDRLKQFKKKDLAFILAGLGTLFMAPLAEHFMMAPENGQSDMRPGFGGGAGSGNGIFGSGSSPYESGNNSIAQGGAIGGAGDIITPLNVRDPSALVMGPGAQQQPPAGSAAPAAPAPAAPSTASSEDYKDALKASASRAASAAVKKSPLPIPKIAVGGSGLRGLGVAGGGTSASGGLGPISSGNQGQAGTGGGGLNLVRNAPGFKGVAGARGPGNPTGLDGTKKAGANAGDAFSRTGSALSGLNAAAAEQIPTGGQGFGGGGQGGAGANDKGPGGSGPGGSKSVGESLAFIEARERMMENLKLEFEKRKLKDPELLLYGIRNDSLKAMASEMTKSLTKGILGFMDPSSSASAGYYECEGGYSNVPLSTPECSKDQATNCMGKDNGQIVFVNVAQKPFKCVKKGGKDTPAARAETAASTAGGVISGAADPVLANSSSQLGSMCDDIDAALKDPKIAEAKKTQAEKMKAELANMISARDALFGTATQTKCGAEGLRKEASAYEFHGQAVGKLVNDPGIAGKWGKYISATEGEPEDADVKEARRLHGEAVKMLEAGKGKVAKFTGGDAPFDELSTSVFNEGAVNGQGAGKITMLARNAREAKKGIVAYPAKEEALLKDLDGLIKGVEAAGLKGDKKPTLTEVVGANKGFKDADARAVTLGATAAAIPDAPAGNAAAKPAEPYNPASDVTKVTDAVKAANDAVGQAGGGTGAGATGAAASGYLKKIAEIEKKKTDFPKDTPWTITPEDKAALEAEGTKAAKAVSDMRKAQGDALTIVTGALSDMKAGTRPAAAK